MISAEKKYIGFDSNSFKAYTPQIWFHFSSSLFIDGSLQWHKDRFQIKMREPDVDDMRALLKKEKVCKHAASDADINKNHSHDHGM